MMPPRKKPTELAAEPIDAVEEVDTIAEHEADDVESVTDYGPPADAEPIPFREGVDDITFESNATLDEPDETPTIDGPPLIGDGPTEVGQFVGVGAEQCSRHDGEWTVDPTTGLITGKAS